MKFIRINFAAIILLLFFSCKKSDGDVPAPLPADNFIRGADISWITEMENAGRKFYNKTGVMTDGFQLMKDLGLNAIRLRVWVNPSAGWNNKADVLAKALRAKALGMHILIDFHYSDSWADPGQQNKPAAWSALDLAGLKNAVAAHTTDVLTTLKNNGITPDWVQVGNETNNGMLWPEGKASVNMASFAQLVNAGYDAVKLINPSIKVIVHVSNGYDNTLFRWLFDGLKNNGGSFDIIGMSLYPTPADWDTKNAQCLANMSDMVARYNKEVMVVEIGMSWDQAPTAKSFIADLIAKTKSVTGNKGLGVFYWEPEAYNSWQGYSLGAFDNSGKPSVAMDGFK